MRKVTKQNQSTLVGRTCRNCRKPATNVARIAGKDCFYCTGCLAIAQAARVVTMVRQVQQSPGPTEAK